MKIRLQVEKAAIPKCKSASRLTPAQKEFVRWAIGQELMTFTDIAKQVSVSRERIRQLALKTGRTGRYRAAAASAARLCGKYAAHPFVIRARERGLDVVPIGAKKFVVNGKETIALNAYNNRGQLRLYTSIRRGALMQADVFVWDLRDGRFLILPDELACFRSTLFAKEMKNGNGSKGGITYSAKHYFRDYIEAWHVFGAEGGSASAARYPANSQGIAVDRSALAFADY